MKKYPYDYSLLDAKGKNRRGTVEASAMSRAKNILRVKFPNCSHIVVKMVGTYHYYQSHRSSLTL